MEKELNKKNYPSNVNKNKLNCGLFNNVDDHPSARVLMNQILNNNNKELNVNQYFKNDINISQNNKNNETLQKKDNNENNLISITLNIPKN
jgi:hypothetical protein